MTLARIRDDDPASTLTLDRLIEELTTLRDSGLVAGNEKVAIGVGFMAESITARSVVMLRDPDGNSAIGISAETELEWQARGDMSILRPT